MSSIREGKCALRCRALICAYALTGCSAPAPSLDERPSASVFSAPLAAGNASPQIETDDVAAGEWPQDRRDPRRTGYAPSETALNAANVGRLNPIWRRRTTGRQLALVANTLLVAHESEAKVAAYAATDGHSVWATRNAYVGPIAALASAGAFAARGADGSLAILSTESGTLQARLPPPERFGYNFRAHPPLAAQGTFSYGVDTDFADCVAEDGGGERCVDVPVGEAVTTVSPTGSALLSFGLGYDGGALARSGDRLFDVMSTQSYDGATQIEAHSALDGSRLWLSDRLGGGDQLPHPPAVSDGRVVAISSSHALSALDEISGATLWTYAAPGPMTGFAVAPGAIYVSSAAIPGSATILVEALALDSGAILASNALPGTANGGELVVTPELVLLGVDDTLVALVAATLALVARVPVGGLAGSPVISNGRVFVGNGGQVLALSPSDSPRFLTLTAPAGTPAVHSKSLRVTAEATGDTSRLTQVAFRGCFSTNCEYTSAPLHFGTISTPPFTHAYPIADFADGPLTIVARAFYSDGVVLDAARRAVNIHRNGPAVGWYQSQLDERGRSSLSVFTDSTLPIIRVGYRYCPGTSCEYDAGIPITTVFTPPEVVVVGKSPPGVPLYAAVFRAPNAAPGPFAVVARAWDSAGLHGDSAALVLTNEF